MMKIDTTFDGWLELAAKQLKKSGVKSANLDALVLLEDATHINRAKILAHPNDTIDKKVIDGLEIALLRRSNREPLAYIRGFSEFWKHKFMVSEDVMIPRPESEAFIELLIELKPINNQRLIDVGTGSGALAISAKLQFPFLKVVACDISEKAIKIAQKNSTVLGADIKIIQSNLLSTTTTKFDYIFANLPYVPPNYTVSKEVKCEPPLAIFADDDGLRLIKKLISKTDNNLIDGGYVFIESLLEQQNQIKSYLTNLGYKYYTKNNMVQLFRL